ncbi:MAG TPA: 4-hydroxy-tetrahydrodipicolinate reductase [Devosia sp.]|nr:4-hydroxy-tetrahydrodipicolinate reductase [Devosia sp.]
MSDLKVSIAGAGGRMGAANIRAVAETAGLAVHSAFDRQGSPAIGRDAGEFAGIGRLGVTITGDVEAALDGAEAIIDFSAPEASVALAKIAAQRGLIHVIGTTGCSADDEIAIRTAALNGARIVKSGNFSLGVNVLLGLVKQAAKALPGFDAEILEMHHNRKVDAPSGTALMLGQAVAEARGIDLDQNAVRQRDGHTGPRIAGSIGFAALRGGGVVGDHTVYFASETERIELTHRAHDRAMFAAGAAQAALWARGKGTGYYSMADVLGFRD